MVNKIKVTPKRKNDPVFTGYIYIADDSWRICSTDLYITGDQQVEFVDTFRIRQQYLPVDSSVWLPFSCQLSYYFSAFGFAGNGIVLGVFSNYDLHPGIPEGFFNREVLKVNSDANKKDSTYWTQSRPVPLTDIEQLDFHRRDSSRVIHESKRYLDSLDKKGNKFNLNNLLTGYYYANSYEHRTLSFSSALQNIQFNTVEGWNAGMKVEFNQGRADDPREWTLGTDLRYGFSNRHYTQKIRYTSLYNMHTHGRFEVAAGKEVQQFNPGDPINANINSVYSLWGRKNYMKLFDKIFMRAEHRSELFNGFMLTARGEFARRMPLLNTSDFSFLKVHHRVYTSNDPQKPFSDEHPFLSHSIAVTEAEVRIRFAQDYVDRPEGKFYSGSKFPVLKIFYRKAFAVNSTAPDYDFMRLSLSRDRMSLGLLGSLSFNFSYADFLSDKRMYFMDWHHFNGNQTWLSTFRLDDFYGLPYYTYSTTGPSFEIHAEQDFGGFLLNKIPFIRKLKLKEIAGFHYLHTDQLNQYMEFTAGIEKLQSFRLQFYTSIADGRRSTIGVVFGIRRSFGL